VLDVNNSFSLLCDTIKEKDVQREQAIHVSMNQITDRVHQQEDFVRKFTNEIKNTIDISICKKLERLGVNPLDKGAFKESIQ